MESIEINGVSINEDILITLQNIKNDAQDGVFLSILDSLQQLIVSSGSEWEDNFEVIKKIIDLRELVYGLTGKRPEKHKNIFTDILKNANDEKSDIVQHVKTNESYYLDRIQRLEEKIIYEGAEHYYNEELFEFLRVLVNMRKLVSSTCTQRKDQ